MAKRKAILNAGLKALLASVETSALGKGAATFVSELAALPEDQQQVLARLTKDQFNEILTQSELSAINAAEAAVQTGQIKALIQTLITKVDRITAQAPAVEKHGIVHNLPYTSIGGLFKGRGAVFAELKQRLADKHPTAIVQPQAIKGLGGIGKTRLAIEFAWWALNQRKVSTVLFVPGDSPQKLHASLAALADARYLDLPGQKQAEQVDAVLAQLRERQNWLMILDNVDDKRAAKSVEVILPQLTGGAILITSRYQRWSGAIKAQALDVLEPDEATRFLLERTEGQRIQTDDDPAIAQELSRELGYLPLTLEQAGAYISHQSLSLAQYLNHWHADRERALTWCDQREMSYPVSAAVTWERTVKKLSPGARALLNISAFLAPDVIPTALFEQADHKLLQALNHTDPSGAHTEFDLQSALADLTAYSMITRQIRGFTVHRITQQVIQTRIGQDKARNLLETALQIVNDHAATDPEDVRNWPVYTPLLPHIELVTQAADAAGIGEPTTRLMSCLGIHLHAKGLYAQAEPFYRRALEIDKQSFRPDHPNVIGHLNNLATLLHDTNRLDDAEPLMRRALEIDEQSLGPDHPKVAVDLNNLAQLLQDTNRLDDAEPLMRRALEIDEQSFGPDHPNVARDLNNLAQLLQDTNRLADAEPVVRRALEIDEQSLGSDHPDVASDLNNLARLLKETNRLDDAEPLMRRALEIDEQSFGPDHPNVARDLGNLAQLLQATNRLDDAEPLMRRALEIDEQSFGPDHPNVAIRLNNLATLLKATNRLDDAEPLMRRALEIDEQSFGPDHPKVAIRLNNLATLLKATNRLGDAEPLMRRALEIDEQSLGPDHPNVAIHLNNLAQLLTATNRLDDAEPLMRRALEIDEQSFGPDHPEVAIRLNNLAVLLQDTNRLDDAEPLMRRALEIDEQSFGPDHPNVAIRLNNLATLHWATNRLNDAEPLMRRALGIVEASLGPDHPNTQDVQENYRRLKQATRR